ncbi:MAG: hypothetical protein J2P15_05110 [Micromonosporaceae bacterium]|nr:hypothetical protein [Micromonosporaceae bacterium]
MKLGNLTQPAAVRAAILSLDPPATRELAATLRAEHLPITRCIGWGVTGFQRVLSQRETVLLDAPADFGPAELHHAVRALRHLAPVIVLAAGPVDVPAALAAGAVNVLDRSLHPTHLAARIHADLRWLGRHPGVERPASEPAQGERVLLRLMMRTRVPICCHQLRWLLGDGRTPIRRDALRARMHRVRPGLSRYGLQLCHDSGWGASRYYVRPV